MKAGRDSPQIQLRLPEELKTWIRARAVENHRSMNGEVLQLLEQSKAQQLKDKPQ